MARAPASRVAIFSRLGHSPEAITRATYLRKGTVSTLPLRVRSTRMDLGGTAVLVQPVHDDPAAAVSGLLSWGTSSAERAKSVPTARRRVSAVGLVGRSGRSEGTA